MKRSDEIKEQRLAKIKELTELNDTEGKNLTDETRAAFQAKYDALKTEIENLAADEKREADMEAIRLEAAAQHMRKLDLGNASGGKTVDKEEKEARDKFNIINFINESEGRNGSNLTGLNKELHEEAVKEARNAGTEIKHNGIPFFIAKGEKRDMTAGTATQGGNTIATELRGVIEYLEDSMVLPSLGADYLTGLTGNIDFPEETNSTIATFKAENATSDEISYTYGKKSMTPKRLPAFVDISNQLLVQSSIGVQNRVSSRLARMIGLGVQNAAINGSGTDSVPEGILNTSGIGSVAIGTNGGNITWDAITKLVEEVDIDNALFGALGFLTNQKVHGALQRTEKSSGTAVYLLQEAMANLNGYNIQYTGQVPSNGTKGSGTNLSTLIFGNFNDLIIGQWGGLDIMSNPYTKAKQGLTEVVVNSYWDVLVRRAASFAAVTDITTA